MRVVVACGNCGGRFPGKEEHVGRRVKCPGCGTVLLVPSPAGNGAAGGEDLYGLKTPEGGQEAPGPPPAAAPPAGPICAACRNPRAADAVICVHCGLDFRTGGKLNTSRGPATFGRYSISRGLNGEPMLTITKRRLFGKRQRCLDLTGYDTVYYDTLDPSASQSGVGTAIGVAIWLAFMLAALSVRRIFVAPVETYEEYSFEVGLAGPDRTPIPLHRDRESSKVREIATWLSGATGLPIKRHDRRSD